MLRSLQNCIIHSLSLFLLCLILTLIFISQSALCNYIVFLFIVYPGNDCVVGGVSRLYNNTIILRGNFRNYFHTCRVGQAAPCVCALVGGAVRHCGLMAFEVAETTVAGSAGSPDTSSSEIDRLLSEILNDPSVFSLIDSSPASSSSSAPSPPCYSPSPQQLEQEALASLEQEQLQRQSLSRDQERLASSLSSPDPPFIACSVGKQRDSENACVLYIGLSRPRELCSCRLFAV